MDLTRSLLLRPFPASVCPSPLRSVLFIRHPSIHDCPAGSFPNCSCFAAHTVPKKLVTSLKTMLYLSRELAFPFPVSHASHLTPQFRRSLSPDRGRLVRQFRERKGDCQ